MTKGYFLITGASSSIGLPLCSSLLQKGYKVIAHVNSSLEKMNELEEMFGDSLSIYQKDFSKNEFSFEDLGTGTIKKLNGIIHCPCPPLEIKSITKTSWGDFELNMSIQLKSLHLLIQHLISCNLLDETRLVVINSEVIAGKSPPKGFAAYATAKFALQAYCSCINQEIKPGKLIINQVSPGMFESNLLKNIPNFVKEINNVGYIDPSIDILEVVNFLLFEASPKIKNQNFVISDV